ISVRLFELLLKVHHFLAELVEFTLGKLSGDKHIHGFVDDTALLCVYLASQPIDGGTQALCFCDTCGLLRGFFQAALYRIPKRHTPPVPPMTLIACSCSAFSLYQSTGREVQMIKKTR